MRDCIKHFTEIQVDYVDLDFYLVKIRVVNLESACVV